MRADGLPDVFFTEEDMTLQDQESDGFAKYYKKPKKAPGKKVHSFQLSGARAGYGSLNITEGLVSCRALLGGLRNTAFP